MQFGKKDTLIDLHYEDMPDQELFLKIRDDLLHSRTGIKLEEHLAGDDPGKLIKEMNSYIARMYRISEEKILHLYCKRMGELMFLRFLHKCGKIIVISKNLQMYWRRNNCARITVMW